MTGTAVQKPVSSTGALPVPAEAAPLRLLRPIAQPADLLRAHEEARSLIKDVLKEGRDYGTIPGTDRPTMYKAGAERLAIAFGLFPQFSILEKEIDHDRVTTWVKRRKEFQGARGNRSFKGWVEEHGESRGLYRYVQVCEIVDRATGSVIGSYPGSASTMESKYIDRPRDSENTVLKMSAKRAFVGAILVVTGLSDQFSEVGRDEEDEVPRNMGETEPEELTLEAALAIPFPWKTPEKYSGKPLADLSDKMLRAVAKACDEKLDELGEDPYYERLLGATQMILEERESKRAASAEAAASTAAPVGELAEQPAAPAAEVTASADAPDDEALDPKEADTTSYEAKTRRLRELMKNPAIRASWRADLDRAILAGLRGRELNDAIARCEEAIKAAEEDVK